MLIAAVASGLVNSKALAARCGVDAIGNVDCAHNRTIEALFGLAYLPRVVHWQSPGPVAVRRLAGGILV